MTVKKTVNTEKNVTQPVEVEKEKVVVKQNIVEKPKRIEIDRTAMIRCRSVVTGGLFYKSPKTGLTINFSEYGDEEWIEAEELITMKSSYPVFLTKPWLVIEDADELVEYLGLKKIYNSIEDVKDIESFFRLPLAEAKEKLMVMPTGMKETVGEKARQMMTDGTLDSIKMIKLIEEELKIQLQ